MVGLLFPTWKKSVGTWKSVWTVKALDGLYWSINFLYFSMKIQIPNSPFQINTQISKPCYLLLQLRATVLVLNRPRVVNWHTCNYLFNNNINTAISGNLSRSLIDFKYPNMFVGLLLLKVWSLNSLITPLLTSPFLHPLILSHLLFFLEPSSQLYLYACWSGSLWGL